MGYEQSNHFQTLEIIERSFQLSWVACRVQSAQ